MKKPLKTKWDLSLIIKDPSEKENDKLREIVKKESYKFIDKWKDRSDYLTDTKILKTALDEYNHWHTHWSNNSTEWYYHNMLSSLDQNSPKIKAGLNNARNLGLKIQNDIQFFEFKLAKISSKTQKIFLKDKSLKMYRHFLERLFASAKYILSEPEEKIMNLKSAPAHSNWVKMLSGFLTKEEVNVIDEDGKKKSRLFSDLIGLMNSQKKLVRDTAAGGFNLVLEKYVDVAENEINSILQNKKINDELRGFDRPDKERHLEDDVESEVVDALKLTVSKKFIVARQYYRLKARLMGVEKLEYHERNVEYGVIDKTYTYKDGVELINKVFTNIDQEFTALFNNFISYGKIDVYPKKGKVSGGFCSYDLITHPTYILLNWTNKLDDVRTLAHEMGHGINCELMRTKQNALNFGNPKSTAEVASTFMEDFVIQELMKEANDELKLSLMMSKLNQDISSIFRQTACYNFETELHQEFRKIGYLSKEKIGEIFSKNMSAYMGNAIKKSKGSESWWVYWSHIRSFFYVYSYASGLLISKSLQAAVKKDPKFIFKVKEFLSAGLSDSPKNIFAEMGIDITDKKFWEKGIKEVEDLLIQTEELAKKLGKFD